MSDCRHIRIRVAIFIIYSVSSTKNNYFPILLNADHHTHTHTRIHIPYECYNLYYNIVANHEMSTISIVKRKYFSFFFLPLTHYAISCFGIPCRLHFNSDAFACHHHHISRKEHNINGIIKSYGIGKINTMEKSFD